MVGTEFDFFLLGPALSLMLQAIGQPEPVGGFIHGSGEIAWRVSFFFLKEVIRHQQCASD